MTSVFKEYFNECWPHVAAVLEGGGQEDVVEKFKAMAIDISEWKQPPDLKQKLSQIIQNLKGVVGITVAWFLAGMATFVQGAPSQTWELRTLTQEMWTDALCPKFKPGFNLIYQPPSENLTLCLPSDSNTDPFKLMDLAEVMLGPYRAFSEIFERCDTPQMDSKAGPVPSFHRNVIFYSPRGRAHLPERKEGTRDILRAAGTMGLNTSCTSAFEAGWYDAYKDVMEYICREAVRDSWTSSTPYMTFEEFEMDVLNATFKQTKIDVLTGPPGITLRSDKLNSGYQGFVMCHRPDFLTLPEILERHVYSKDDDYYARLVQRMCKYKKYHGKDRGVDIRHSKLEVDGEGKVFIENPTYHGMIGDCRDSLEAVYQTLFGGEESEASIMQRVLHNPDITNKYDRVTPLSRQEYFDLLRDTDREEEHHHKLLTGNVTEHTNGTAQQTLRRELLGEPYAVSPYWLVWSALGAAAVCAGKLVWNHHKARSEISYRSFRAAEAEEEAEAESVL
eukprot:Blabericola_migrator_1__2166@NODE_1599_length_4200_cov_24_677232_g1045_i0_p1_GENE_NODE_1599_length_4200_cov_24_677232_g1045_i0NODE_1599_length_4200_cov_24_677232_g1045_i0_p1_ORF_typecomplete_len522_score85_94_NODE_1599_length_4200_cov_24_677232_g1045_i026354146